MTRTLAAVAVIAALAGTARGDPPAPAVQAQADALFQQAQTDYEQGKYQEAIPLFQQAYALVPDPNYLYDTAQSYRKVLDCEEATAFYERYLEAAPDAPNRDKVQQWVAQLAPCVARARSEQAAAQRGLELAREREEAEARRRAELAAAREVEVDRGRPLRMSGIVAGALGTAGLALGLAYSIRGANLKDQVARACMPSCNWDRELALDRDGRTANTIATASWIGGGVALAAGAAMYLWGRTRVAHVVVVPRADGATVGARLRF